MTFTAQARLDFDAMIANGVEVETIVVKRLTYTYDDAGKTTATETTKATVTGSWQPVSGQTMRAEAGLKTKSVSEVYVPYDTDVLEEDKLYRADGSFEYVNYCRKWQTHIEVMTKKTSGAA